MLWYDCIVDGCGILLVSVLSIKKYNRFREKNQVRTVKMPRRKPSFGEFPEQQYYVDVTLSEDHLNGNGRLVGKVSERTVSLRNIIADIKKNHKCFLTEETLFYAAQTLGEAYFERLRRGFAVDVLGLGKIYHALDGTFVSQHDVPSKRPKIVPRFTPSKVVAAACKKLKCMNLYESDVSPKIYTVEAFPRGTNGEVAEQSFVKVSGRNIKVAGEGAGVFFVPRVDGEAVAIPPEKIWKNFPKSLEFYIPDDVMPGTYDLEVRTRWSRSGRVKKELCRAAVEIVVTKKRRGAE